MTHEKPVRKIVVTGGGTGIGRAIAQTFIGKGDQVAIIGRREAVLADTARALGPGCSYFSADVGDIEQVAAAAAEIVRRWGSVDVLINNAGYNLGLSPEMGLEQAKEVWDEMLRANLTGAFLMAYAFAPHLARPGGRIINVSTDAAINGGVGFRTLGYVAAKTGLLGLTRALAQEYGPQGITVNAVAPGFIHDTEGNLRLDPKVVQEIAAHLPARRPGLVEDVASAVYFLASPGAGFITGEVVRVNGGR